MVMNTYADNDFDWSMFTLWNINMDSVEYDCECPGPPPPGFHLPPPPRPPFLYEVADCSEAPLLDFETCHAMSVIDAEYHISPAMPPLVVIAISSFLFLALAVLATALFWKHKKKMRNLFPCKRSPQNHCDVTEGNAVIYEDLTNIRPRVLPQPSMEMLVVNSGDNYLNNCSYSMMSHTHSPVFYCPPLRDTSQDLYNPVYEELSNGSEEREESDGESETGHGSEAEFAEDELSLGEGIVGGQFPPHPISSASSLQGSTGNDLCCDIDSSDADDHSHYPCTKNSNPVLLKKSRSLKPHQKHQHESLDRRQCGSWRKKGPECGDFHEGILLNALFQFYPSVVGVPGSISQPIHQARDSRTLPYILPVPGPGSMHKNPFETVPGLSDLHQHHPMFTFRPMKPSSHDSDSGYSNNTSGGGQSSIRGYKDHCQTNDLVLS